VSAPMYYVALMTFILIFSSVTMVAVDVIKKIVLYMFLTLLVEGYLYQAWEWKNFKR
jgi:cytochrome c oxidase subunit 3